MLYREFAVEPKHIGFLSDLKLIEARFGYDKGSLISAFPTTWFRDVLVKLQANSNGSQLDKLTDTLKLIKQKSIHTYGRAYAGNSWCDAAITSHRTQPFHRIIDPSLTISDVYRNSLYELIDDDFELIPNCKRLSTEMARVAQELLVQAEKIVIVDPFAKPNIVGYRKTILEMTKLPRGQSVELIIFSEEEKQDSYEIRKAHLISLSKELPTKIKLTWCFISDNDRGDIHPRVLFTSKGGIKFDRGFQEPNDYDQRNAPNYISVLTRAQLEKFTLDYNYNQLIHPLVINHLWCSH